MLSSLTQGMILDSPGAEEESSSPDHFQALLAGTQDLLGQAKQGGRKVMIASAPTQVPGRPPTPCSPDHASPPSASHHTLFAVVATGVETSFFLTL